MHSAYAIPQLRDLYKNASVAGPPFVWKWQTIPSLCLARWTGMKHLPISYSEASWCGLLNYRQCVYEPTALELLPESCQRALPELADYDDAVPSLRDGIPESSLYGRRWPSLRGARLFLGLGDGACANIGSKCTTASRIACTVGTSAAARVCLPCPVQSPTKEVAVPPGLFCYRVDRSHVLVGGALTDGGSVIEWIKQLLNLQNNEAFENCMEAVQGLVDKDENVNKSAGTATPTTVPFLSGERSTGFRTGATGAVLGLTRDTTPAHVLKSCLEGVTLRLTAIVRLIQQVSTADATPPPRIIVSGRALEVNQIWRQMIADSSGLDVLLDDETHEGTSRGVACMVARAIEDTSTAVLPEETIRTSLTSKPNQALCSYWAQAAASQDELIDALSPLYAKTRE